MNRAAVGGLRAGSVAMRALSDESLALRAIEGDEGAFAAIFDRHHQSLHRYCLALLGSSQDAQDALQNTMIKALRALPGEERRIALKPWLYRIAHNESIELLRRRRETRPLDPDLAVTGYGLAEATATRERLRVLLSDLDKLPERQRGALVMRELAGLGFAEIGTALGTSAGAVRQTLYEARQSLRRMDEGREMSCARVTRALSDGDGRIARRRDLRSHLRTCADCRGFSEEIERRRQAFAALAPLSPAAAAGLLHGLLGGHGGGGGLASVLGAGAAKSLGTSAALKGAATVAVVAAIGAGTADRGGLIDLGSPAGDHSQTIRIGQPAASGLPGTQQAHFGSAATDATAGLPAGAKGANRLGTAQATNTAGAPTSAAGATPGAVGTPAGGAKATQPGEAGSGQIAIPGSAKSDAASAPGSTQAAKKNEKQLPSASEHGQETAASHKAANHGGETAEEHKAEGHANAGKSHPAHPAHPATPSHPAQPPNPSEEELPPQISPATPESNGNGGAKGNGSGNGKGNSSAGAEASPPGEAGKTHRP
jgi:RNA polymerase sigma factor (sigma-70 family)